MDIRVNDTEVREPAIDFEFRVPEGDFAEAEVDGRKVRYFYGFSRTVLRSSQLRGFTLHANGKTAQAPPFFFQVESTASGQHGTRYMYGTVEIDFLDEGSDDETDLISTDRQEIDWENPLTKPLLEWGDELTRKALREWANRREDQSEKWVLDDPTLATRMERLDEPAKRQVTKAIRTLGRSEPDEARLLELAGALIAVFEYRHFHDFVSQIQSVEDDPDELNKLLTYFGEWKVLESRAILEVVKGRIEIIGKFHSMLVEDAPETAPRIGQDNLHDLIAAYPWLLNVEWQVLVEERSVTKQLREWADEDVEIPEDRRRFDYLALEQPGHLIVIEIKRPSHPVTLEEIQRLQTYRERLKLGSQSVRMALVSGPNWATAKADWEGRPELDLMEWSEVRQRTRNFYEQYRAVLEADVEHRDFLGMQSEVARTREILETGSTYRGSEARSEGLGSQYVDHSGHSHEGET
jgi:hypothetical protein